mmetsp:Transcript_2442/g.3805  ORF Transcript_2442/g.3805 Transcript_2442/m.3805 type:complete len:85 (+) Transcript_2442:335-589(+)
MENFRAKTASILRGLESKQDGEENVYEVDVAGDIFGGLKTALDLGPTPDPIPVEEIAQKNYDRFKTSKAGELAEELEGKEKVEL